MTQPPEDEHGSDAEAATEEPPGGARTEPSGHAPQPPPGSLRSKIFALAGVVAAVAGFFGGVPVIIDYVWPPCEINAQRCRGAEVLTCTDGRAWKPSACGKFETCVVQEAKASCEFDRCAKLDFVRKERTTGATGSSEAVSKLAPLKSSCVDPGEAHFDSLVGYFHQKNPELTESIDQDSQESYESRRVRFVSAPAGSGKSTFFRHASATEVLDLPGVFSKAPERPDLVVGTRTISKLRGGSELPEDLVQRIHAGPTSGRVLVLDGLDEIHPDAASAVLDEVLRTRSESGGSALYVVGRPEAFRDHVMERVPTGVRLFELKLPEFSNRGDVRVLYRSVESFRQGAPLASFETVVELLAKKHYLCGDISTLATARIVFENADKYVAQTDAQVRESILSGILRRNAPKTGRPPPGDAAYRTAFEGVLLLGDADKVRWLSSRSFEINPSVSVPYGDAGTVAVERLLARSHLASVDPLSQYTLRYSFEPAWIPEHFEHTLASRLDCKGVGKR